MALAGTLRGLTSLALTYATGDVLVKGLTFLLLPLFIRYLPPDQYGIVALTELLRILLILILSLGMSSAALRFVHLFDDRGDERRFFGAMWAFMIIVPGIVTGLLLFAGSQAPLLTVLGIPFAPYISFTLLTAYLNTAFILLPWTLFRARDQARQYTVFAVFNAVVVTGATLYQVVVLREEASGWVSGQLQATVLVAIISFGLMIRRTTPNLRLRLVLPAIAFALPLAPHFLAHWILGVFDRIILERLTDLATVGWYSLGYQLGQTYQVLITAMNSALIPMFGRAIADPEERELLPKVVTYYVFALVGIGLSIAVIGPPAILLLFPLSYAEAARIVPWVTAGYLAFGLYYIPINHLSMTMGETRKVPLITLAVAGLNIGLNLLLIPRFGALAAAITTAISYAALALAMFGLARSYGRVPLELGRVFRIGLAGFIVYLPTWLIDSRSATVTLLVGLIGIALYPLMVVLLGTWSAEERGAAVHQIRALLADFRTRPRNKREREEP